MRLLTDEGSNWSYPSDYLLCRLRGRIERSIDYIVRSGPEVMRAYVEREHKWVYLQMNKRLRERLWPFFFYREIKRISEWLRLGDVSSQLELSLLSDGMKGIFLKTMMVSVRIEKLETFLSAVSEKFTGIRDAFERGGLKAFEESLMNTFLSMMVSYPSLEEFFRYIIDFRNLMGLYKHVRWGIETMPLFLSGGNIDVRELREAFLSGDISQVYQFFSRLFDIEAEDPSELEVGFYQGLRGILKRRYLAYPLDPVAIPYYLWNLYVESVLSGA